MKILKPDITAIKLPKNTFQIINVSRCINSKFFEQMNGVSYETLMQAYIPELKNCFYFEQATAILMFKPSNKSQRFKITITVVEHL